MDIPMFKASYFGTENCKSVFFFKSFLKVRTPESSNDYVRITVSYVLAFLRLSSIPSADITILADNDYYSQTSSPTYSHLSSLPRFNHLDIPISEANKTGLGSSAALITSLTAAMLAFFGGIDISDDDGKRTVHNLAQAAHCAAQGKVGSGFDIAAAVYGSCIYRRFKPEILEHVLVDSDVYDSGFIEELNRVVGTTWDMEATPFRLPVGLRVVMGDVAAGSATPSMVRSVLKWKASVSGAEKVWKNLGASNKRLIELFGALEQFPSDLLVAELREGINNVRSTSRPSLYEALDELMTEFAVYLEFLHLTLVHPYSSSADGN
jgi:phosphomevalonate kinase